MLNFDKFKTPEAKAIMSIGGITIATSVALNILPKGVSVAVLTMGAGLAATRYFAQKVENDKQTI